MSRFSIEQDIEDFQKGKIDEYDLKSSLRREYGSCSCMSISIERAIRDTDHRESHELRRDLESRERRCHEEEQRQDYEGM